MKAVPYILGVNQGVVKEMAGSSHTPASCLSMLRSCQEAGKKQLRVWLEYACNVAMMFLWSPYDSSEMVRSGFEDGSKVIEDTKHR